MDTFLKETVAKIASKHSNLSELTIIVPSKRAGGYIQQLFQNEIDSPIFSPKIFSIESFVEFISDLKIIENTSLIYESYAVYKTLPHPSEKESFESYISWINTLLNDFNEIDRYLVDPHQFFNYLSSIKAIDRWNADPTNSVLIDNYLAFWNNLETFYFDLKESLLKSGAGYQGLVYRLASENVAHYIQSKGAKPHIFIGFNALNKAEQNIIQEILAAGNSEIYWDIDQHLFEDEKHSASYFIRKYMKSWPFLKQNLEFKGSNFFTEQKNIYTIETQKNSAQAKYIGDILASFTPTQLENTAIVLADEKLLIPILYSLPSNIENVNVTMGIQLKKFPITTFFELLFDLRSKQQTNFYFKDVLAILYHPTANLLLSNAHKIAHEIIEDNITQISHTYLEKKSDSKDLDVITKIFTLPTAKTSSLIENFLELIAILKRRIKDNKLDRLVLYELFQVISRLKSLNQKYVEINTVRTLQKLFDEEINYVTLDLMGDSFKGLQIMGVLETRGLDFENVIMTSVNEGTLPSGKSNASFITYDLKKQFGLPLYYEKDAIYSYHFYRLLQRAKEVYLMYNSFSEGINSGEKSRFILQLEIKDHTQHTLEHFIVSPTIPIKPTSKRIINKSSAVMKRLKEIAEDGFSPSALTNYIRNPIDFYFQNVLKIKETNEVEEIIAANTMGTIMHECLEELYEPIKGQFLSDEILSGLEKKVDEVVEANFIKKFKSGNYNTGKNLLIFEVVKRYIKNLISLEKKQVQNNESIKVVELEQQLRAEIMIPSLDYKVFLKGTVDRIDQINGSLRIIDYKSGTVNKGEVQIMDWNTVHQDYKYSKAFQVLTYTLMMYKTNPFQNATAGIISFKNLNNGFMPFGTKPSSKSRNIQSSIDDGVLQDFTTQLTKLIEEICDPNIPFVEKEIK